MGSSLSWILVEEETPRRRSEATSLTMSCQAIPRHPSLRSEQRPKDAKKRGSGVALGRLEIAKKIIWDDEAFLEIRCGLKEAFHGLKGQGI